VLGRGGEIAWLALAAIGEDGALVQFAVTAMAARLATLSPQGVERARQKWLTSEAGFKQAGEKLLSMEQLGAERAKTMVHGVTVGICRSLYILTYRRSQSFAETGKKAKKSGNPAKQNGKVSRAASSPRAKSVARKPGRKECRRG
jgi:hypothetical protein